MSQSGIQGTGGEAGLLQGQGWSIHRKAGKAESMGADASGWVEVEVGSCGSSFLRASVFSGRQEARLAAESRDGRGGAGG